MKNLFSRDILFYIVFISGLTVLLLNTTLSIATLLKIPIDTALVTTIGNITTAYVVTATLKIVEDKTKDLHNPPSSTPPPTPDLQTR